MGKGWKRVPTVQKMGVVDHAQKWAWSPQTTSHGQRSKVGVVDHAHGRGPLGTLGDPPAPWLPSWLLHSSFHHGDDVFSLPVSLPLLVAMGRAPFPLFPALPFPWDVSWDLLPLFGSDHARYFLHTNHFYCSRVTLLSFRLSDWLVPRLTS